MKFSRTVYIFVLFLLSFSHLAIGQNHIVKKGETVYSIANKYGISDQDIYSLNPTAIKGIKEGQNLKISTSGPRYKYYTVKAKETVYSISKANNITTQELLAVNPMLTPETLKEGQTIKIPIKNLSHKVVAKETIYGISKAYDVSEEALRDANPQLAKGLKNGMTLVIPLGEPAPSIVKKEDKETAYKLEGFPKTETKTLRVGIFLPLTSGTESHRTRFVEYYRGFLMAVQEMKSKGYSMDIYAFDLGSTAKMHALLESSDIKDLHLIIGGVTDQEVQSFADYTKRHNIKYVIPFPLKDSERIGENCFVVTRSNQDLENKALNYYLDEFSGKNVVIIKDNTNNKEDFTSKLKQGLERKGRHVPTIRYSLSMEEELLPYLTGETVIIPSSNTQATLSKLVAILKVIKEKYPEKEIKLAGYPDWQAYGQLQNDLKSFNATIFSSFYLDESAYWVQVFNERFEKWYNTSVMNTFPKYGFLGYDTGLFFMTALARHGFNFEKKILSSEVSTLQTAFRFTQSQSGGYYINDGLYIVDYSEKGVKKEYYTK